MNTNVPKHKIMLVDPDSMIRDNLKKKKKEKKVAPLAPPCSPTAICQNTPLPVRLHIILSGHYDSFNRYVK